MAGSKSPKVKFWGALMLAAGVATAGYTGYDILFVDYFPTCDGKPMQTDEKCLDSGGKRHHLVWRDFEEQRSAHEETMRWGLGFGVLFAAGGTFLLWDEFRGSQAPSAPKEQSAPRGPVEY
jgi:hypothetical protein